MAQKKSAQKMAMFLLANPLRKLLNKDVRKLRRLSKNIVILNLVSLIEKMIESEMPQVAQQLAIKNAFSALKENAASTLTESKATSQSDIKQPDGIIPSK
jgi:c-di-GMP-related signal transduction protein